MTKTLYGQYCPIAISLELLGGRWTLLIIRELVERSTRFNDIHRGLPRMSRSLLSSRLKELETAKLITRTHSARSGHAEYALTEAGRSLFSVITAVGKWGQEWASKAVALDEVDGGYLMWSIKKSAKWLEEMGAKTVAQFEFSHPEVETRLHWLVIEQDEIDLCYVDPGLDIDAWITTDLRTMVEVWMGWRRLSDALRTKEFNIDGAPELTADPLRWIGQSPLAGLSQRPSEEQVGAMVMKVKA